MTPNVFHSLLRYRPRERRSSQENFLTAAFAYTLSTNPEICRDWVAHVSGTSAEVILGTPTVKTQVSYPALNGKIRSIIDMVISCELANGSVLTLLCEHKWDSPADPRQIDEYSAIARAADNHVLVFIAPSVLQVARIEGHTDEVRTLLWRDVHDFLRDHDTSGAQEFVDFLDLVKLNRNEPFCRPGLVILPGAEECGGRATIAVDKGDTSCVGSLAEATCPFVGSSAEHGTESRRGTTRRRTSTRKA